MGSKTAGGEEEKDSFKGTGQDFEGYWFCLGRGVGVQLEEGMFIGAVV